MTLHCNTGHWLHPNSYYSDLQSNSSQLYTTIRQLTNIFTPFNCSDWASLISSSWCNGIIGCIISTEITNCKLSPAPASLTLMHKNNNLNLTLDFTPGKTLTRILGVKLWLYNYNYTLSRLWLDLVNMKCSRDEVNLPQIRLGLNHSWPDVQCDVWDLSAV